MLQMPNLISQVHSDQALASDDGRELEFPSVRDIFSVSNSSKSVYSDPRPVQGRLMAQIGHIINN